MAIYVGEGVVISLVVTDPLTGLVLDNTIEGLSVFINFFEPGLSPATVPADRTPAGEPVSMSWDSTIVNSDGTTGAWKVTADTTGWAAGKWWYQAEVSGAYNAWVFGSFKLVA